MVEIRYVVRFFINDKYVYSVHCDQEILEDVIQNAKDNGQTVKVVAYKNDSSEV